MRIQQEGEKAILVFSSEEERSKYFEQERKELELRLRQDLETNLQVYRKRDGEIRRSNALEYDRLQRKQEASLLEADLAPV